MGHPSLSHSFRRMPRGGVEQENYGLLCSKVADLVLPNISDRWLKLPTDGLESFPSVNFHAGGFAWINYITLLSYYFA
ncbi:hypothetical protein Tco_0616335 [Tanacetum coccineum]